MATTTTRHTCNGDKVTGLPFGKLAPAGECARCDERRNGAPARTAPAWVTRREMTARYAAQDERARKAHYAPGGPHSRGTCAPICTAFDW